MRSETLTERFAEDTRRIPIESNAMLENDRFVYVSGYHGTGWIDKDANFPQTDRVPKIGPLAAGAFRFWNLVERVIESLTPRSWCVLRLDSGQACQTTDGTH